MNSATPASVDKSPDRVREMFRQIAPRYDAMNHLLSLNRDKRWRDRATRAVRWPDAGGRVLDVCCGTGDLTMALAGAAPEGVTVTGSDFCHAMLQIARVKSIPADRRPSGYVEADSMSLPFGDNEFDVVTVAFGLRNIVDTDAGLAEMTRVCRPGGQVMVLEFSTPTTPVLSHGYHFYFRQVLPRVGQLLARNDKSAYSYLPQSVAKFPSGQALADRMRVAGLSDVEMETMMFGTVTNYWGIKNV